MTAKRTATRALRSLSALGFLVLTAACWIRGATAAEPFRSGDVSFNPRRYPLKVVGDTYDSWWRETEQCSGLRRDKRSIEWFVVMAPAWLMEQDGVVLRVVGQYAPPNKITLVEPHLFNARTVRHEILHSLIDQRKPILDERARDPWHPFDYFDVKCGGIV